MSAAATRDKLIGILSVPFGSHSVDKKFSVLESTHTAIVVGWSSYTGTPLTYTKTENRWEFTLMIFVKDEGDPDLAMNRHIAAVDTIVATLLANPTLDDVVERITAMRSTNSPSQARELLGSVWVAFDFFVEVIEYADSVGA